MVIVIVWLYVTWFAIRDQNLCDLICAKGQLLKHLKKRFNIHTYSCHKVRWAGWSCSWFVPVKATEVKSLKLSHMRVTWQWHSDKWIIWLKILSPVPIPEVKVSIWFLLRVSKVDSAANIPVFIALWVLLILGTFIKPGLQLIRASPGKASWGILYRKMDRHISQWAQSFTTLLVFLLHWVHVLHILFLSLLQR